MRLFPELCIQIKELCLMNRREAILLRQAELVEEVRLIVQSLSLQKTDATFKLVRSLLKPNSTKNKVVLSEALRTAKSQFERSGP